MHTITPDPYLVQLLTATVHSGASDLHIVHGRRPTVRKDGVLVDFEDQPEMLDPDIRRMGLSIVRPDQMAELEEKHQLDLSFGIDGVGRFRVNIFEQREHMSIAMRVIPTKVRSLEDLGAPRAVHELLDRPYGLVLVVGPTGSGKSTTLAAMIDRINERKPLHILTIEDPVEFVHFHKTALINQREVGTDVNTFADGLKAALREDPDVVLMGEMRDVESISIGLSLAETGHLVFATLHTNDAAQSLDRVVDVFPAEKHEQIQTMLAGALQGVVSQRLVPGIGGGRLAAYEILMGTDAVRNLIREGKSRQMRNVLATGSKDGMQTLEDDLARLVVAGLITMDVAKSISAYPDEIQTKIATERASSLGAATAAAGQMATSGNAEAPAGQTAPPPPPEPEPSGRFGRRKG
jgi:twitching motility protein PilT